MNIKLITTDKSLLSWRSLGQKLKAIIAELNQIEGAKFTIDIEYRNVTPTVANGYITHAWMDELRKDVPANYQFVAFHMSVAQSVRWGIEPGMRGAHQRDKDKIGEFYFWADEKTRRGRLNQFIQTFLHEFRHAFMYETTLPDDTHDQHVDGDIRGSFKALKLADYNPSREEQLGVIASLKARIASLLAKPPLPLLHPVPGVPRVTQAYGVPSTRYKLTGRHIGTDYGIPVGTGLVAPWDGLVTTVGTHPALGFFLHFEYTHNSQKFEERWCHLRELPKTGAYKRGELVAFSGNTGMSTGPHLHREKWYNDVRLDLINKNNWSQFTLDPEKPV